VSEVDLSVIISTYARPVQVREAIAAVRAQDHPGPIETIVVWDKNEPEWELADDDPHRPVRILFNDHGNGLPGSRNCGAEAARAPVLGFCDDDDLWLPAKARRQLTLLKETGADCAITGIELLSDDQLTPRPGTGEVLRYADLLRSRHIEACMVTAMVRAEAFWGGIGPLDEHLPGGYAEDYEWMLRAARHQPIVVAARAAGAGPVDGGLPLPPAVARLGGRALAGARPQPRVRRRAPRASPGRGADRGGDRRAGPPGRGGPPGAHHPGLVVARAARRAGAPGGGRGARRAPERHPQRPRPGPVTALEAVTALLGLRPAGAPGSTSTTARFGVVAGRSGPRFLVPLDHPAAAPQACLAYLGLRDLRTRATRGAAGLALRAGVRRGVIAEVLEADAGPGSLLDELGRLLEHPEHGRALAVAVGLGQHDEVWKPTLQVFRPDGEPAAFVKVGLGAVADQLVATEAATLALWGQEPDPRLVVPELLAEARWEGLRLAVVAPLPTDARRLPAQQVTDAWPVRELDGPLRTVAPADAPWWQARRAANAEHRRVDELLDRIEQRHRAPASWGRWHGDWVPWNLARCHRGLVAWDWEYSRAGRAGGPRRGPRCLPGGTGRPGPIDLGRAHRSRPARAPRRLADCRPPCSCSSALAPPPTPTAPMRDAARRTSAPPSTWLADATSPCWSPQPELEHRLGRPPADGAELLAADDATPAAAP
jgi:hypothetical protein